MNKFDSPYLPLLHDMLAAGVPERTALQWHEGIWMLKSHCEHLIQVIEDQIGDREVLREAAENAQRSLDIFKTSRSS